MLETDKLTEEIAKNYNIELIHFSDNKKMLDSLKVVSNSASSYKVALNNYYFILFIRKLYLQNNKPSQKKQNRN